MMKDREDDVQKSTMKRNIYILLCVISAAAAFAVYYNALSNGFIWDDPIVLKNQLSAFQSVKDIFFPPAGIPQFGIHYYRPMIIVTLLIDSKVWGKTPFGFHLSVVLFHVINTILVYFLARMIFKKYGHPDLAALVASFLFAVHPIHTESVAWMAGRSDVVAATFFFASLLLYLAYTMKPRAPWSDDRKGLFFLILSCVAFFLAAASKEASLSLILLLPVIDLSFSQGKLKSDSVRRKEKKLKKKEKKKKKKDDTKGKEVQETQGSIIPDWWGRLRLASYLPFIAVTILYFILRHKALAGQGHKELQSRNYFDIPGYFINSYGFYIEKLFLPVNLKAFIPEIPGGALFTLFSIATFLGLISIAVWFLFRKKEIFFFIIAFFFLTILPSTSVALMKISETPLAERYLYMPSFSLALIAGFIALSIPVTIKTASVRRIIASGALAVLLSAVTVAYSIQTVKRNTVWKDDILFWKDIVRKVPNEGLPHLNLGLVYNENDRLDEAEEEYWKAINGKYDDEGRSTAYNNLGNVYLARKDYAKAEEYFRTSISIRPSYPTPYYSMALSYWRRYFDTGERGLPPDPNLMLAAIDSLDKALQLNPQYVKALALKGNALYLFKRYDEARRNLETVLRYEQEGPTADLARKILEKMPSQ